MTGSFDIMPSMSDGLSEIPGLLVIRLGALGDVANTLPAVAGLREASPDLRIGWLVEPPSRDLVAASGLANEIIMFPRKTFSDLAGNPLRWFRLLKEWFAFRRVLRSYHYDFVLDFQGNLKSGLMGSATGARGRIGFARGFCREMNWVFNPLLALPKSKQMPRVEKNMALVQVLDTEAKIGTVKLSETASDVAKVKTFMETLPSAGPLVVLHPGTSDFGRFKRWPPDRFGQLAVFLKEQFQARSVITRGPAEAELAQLTAAASNGAAVIAPELTIGELIELLRRADLFVGADTGPLHIAALLKRPVVAIFGPKDPVIYGPYGTQGRIVRLDLECSPCKERDCDHSRCILDIPVEMVKDACADMLGTTARRNA
jgi:heptosyltransferase I